MQSRLQGETSGRSTICETPVRSAVGNGKILDRRSAQTALIRGRTALSWPAPGWSDAGLLAVTPPGAHGQNHRTGTNERQRSRLRDSYRDSGEGGARGDQRQPSGDHDGDDGSVIAHAASGVQSQHQTLMVRTSITCAGPFGAPAPDGKLPDTSEA